MKSILIFLFLAIPPCFSSALSKQAFESCCEHVLGEEIFYFSPKAVNRGEAIFVNTSVLDRFFKEFFNEIPEPFVLVSSGGLGTIDERYTPWLENKKLIHWFGAHMTLKHSKTTPIPLGMSWIREKSRQEAQHYLYNLSSTDYFLPKPYKYLVNWSDSTHASREAIRHHFLPFEGCRTSKRIPFSRYMQILRQSQFVISPKGLNLDCFRTWEALYAGSVPVVESSGIEPVYDNLPVIVVADLSTTTEEEIQQKWEEKQNQTFCLDRLHFEYWKNQIDEKKKTIMTCSTD